MSEKGKISFIEKDEDKRLPLGPIKAGEHLYTVLRYYVHVEGEKEPFEVDRATLLKFDTKRKRITDKYLDSFKGKDANILRSTP